MFSERQRSEVRPDAALRLLEHEPGLVKRPVIVASIWAQPLHETLERVFLMLQRSPHRSLNARQQ